MTRHGSLEINMVCTVQLFKIFTILSSLSYTGLPVLQLAFHRTWEMDQNIAKY